MINCREYRNELASKFAKLADSEIEYLREKARELNGSIQTGYAFMADAYDDNQPRNWNVTCMDDGFLISDIKNNNQMKLYDCIEGADIRLLDFVDYILLMRNLGSKKIAWRKLSINIEDMENYINEYNIDKYENLDIYQLDKISINEIRKKFYQIINQKIENFINLNRDSKYEFSVCKYLCNSTMDRY